MAGQAATCTRESVKSCIRSIEKDTGKKISSGSKMSTKMSKDSKAE